MASSLSDTHHHFQINEWLKQKTEPTIQTYRPVFLRLNREEDRKQLELLLQQKPHIQIYDQIQRQLAELVKTRSPQSPSSDAELAQAVETWLGDTPVMQYGVWVYYPWSERLVHLLDEPEFIELRTARNLYKITTAERDLLANKRIGIIGLSVGQSIALTVALERSFGEIRLADFDQLDLSNLNRIRSGLHDLGIAKVVIAARQIAEIDPFLQVTCFEQGINETNLDQFLLEGGKLDILVDECDSLDIKILARYRARELRIPVVMDTSDRGLIDVERFDREDRPILHGLMADLNPAMLKGLSNEDKVAYVLPLLGIETLSRRAKASLVEIGHSITTWPQLASSVTLGGAVGADICRRIALDQYHESGRYFIDLEELVGDKASTPTTPLAYPMPAPQTATLSASERAALIETVLSSRSNEHIHDERVRLAQACAVELIEAAILAPSGGNCQPWQWTYRDGTLFLFHDRQRSASWLDYRHAGSYVALGAACENVVLQAHALGLEVKVTSFPLSHENRLVATLDFFAPGTRQEVEPHSCDELVKVIAHRQTNRKRGARAALPANVLAQIKSAAQSVAGTTCAVLENERDLLEIGQMLGVADRLRMLDQQTHQEMMNEIRWSRSEAERSRDGLDLELMELSISERAALQVARDWPTLNLVREWKGGRALENMAQRAIRCSSSVALVSMSGHRPTDYFAGGGAIQRAWLTAAASGVALQPMTALPYMFARLGHGGGEGLSAAMIDELQTLRERYCQLFALQGWPGEILLLRLSLADSPSTRALRRPVQEVLTFD